MKYAWMLTLALLIVACGDDPIEKQPNVVTNNNTNNTTTNNSSNNTNTLDAEVEVRDMNGELMPLADGDSMEIISGFQGGWHIEPVLRIRGVELDALSGMADIRAFEMGTENEIASAGVQELDPLYFQADGDSYLLYSQPVILAVDSPDQVTDTMATLRIEIELDNGSTATIELDVMLVDENEEAQLG